MKRLGTRESGESPRLTIRITRKLSKELDAEIKRARRQRPDVKRSDVVRELVEAALADRAHRAAAGADKARTPLSQLAQPLPPLGHEATPEEDAGAPRVEAETPGSEVERGSEHSPPPQAIPPDRASTATRARLLEEQLDRALESGVALDPALKKLIESDVRALVEDMRREHSGAVAVWLREFDECVGELAVEARDAGLSDSAKTELLTMMEDVGLPMAIVQARAPSRLGAASQHDLMVAFRTLAAELGAALQVPPAELPFPPDDLASSMSVIQALSVALRDGAHDFIKKLGLEAQRLVKYQVYHPHSWETAKRLLAAILDSPSDGTDALYEDLAAIICAGFPGAFDPRENATAASRIKAALSARPNVMRYAEIESERADLAGQLKLTGDDRLRTELEFKSVRLRVLRAQRMAIDALVAVGVEKTKASAMFDSDKAGGVRYVEKKFLDRGNIVSSP